MHNYHGPQKTLEASNISAKSKNKNFWHRLFGFCLDCIHAALHPNFRAGSRFLSRNLDSSSVLAAMDVVMLSTTPVPRYFDSVAFGLTK
jgi:hypothetical protein